MLTIDKVTNTWSAWKIKMLMHKNRIDSTDVLSMLCLDKLNKGFIVTRYKSQQL